MKEYERILSEKLITEFMGRVYPDDNPNANLYSSSWDWLMLTVEKIESIYPNLLSFSINGERVIIKDFTVKQTLYSGYFEGSTKIEVTYKAVVEFIKWYNKQKL